MTARLCALALLILTAAPAAAFSPPNPPVYIQFDETFEWSCDYGVSVDTIISSSATYLQGGTTGTDCTGLLQNVTTNGTRVTWIWSPDQLLTTKEHVCWVHIVAQAVVGGGRYACDGKAIVKRNRPTS